MKKLLLMALVAIVIYIPNALAQTVDPSYPAVVTGGTEPEGGILFSDGKYLLFGDFKRLNGVSKPGVAKFNADGTFDNTFNIGTGPNGPVLAAALQTDGKILLAGPFTTFNGVKRSVLIRLNADGTIDNTFTPNITLYNTSIDYNLLIQPDGKILLTGPYRVVDGGNTSTYLMRFNSDGSKDATFNASFSGIEDMALQSDGKIIVTGFFAEGIARLTSTGAVDDTFNPGGAGFNSGAWVHSVEISATGQIFVGGDFSSYNGTANKYLICLTSAGALDATWQANGKPNYPVQDLYLQADGKLLVAGLHNLYGTTMLRAPWRLNTNGSVDGTINVGTGTGNSILSTVTANASGAILVTGPPSVFKTFNGQTRNGVALLESNGTLKPTSVLPNFQTGTWVLSIKAQGADKYLIGHQGDEVNGTASTGFERLNLDGTVDATFSGNSKPNNDVRAITIDHNGKILIGGEFTAYNGTTTGRIARLSASGVLETTFTTNTGTGLNSRPYVIVAQPDGKILVGGAFTTFNGTSRKGLVRLNENGTLDATFNTADGFTTSTIAAEIYDIEMLSDGKILVAGKFNSFNGNTINSLVRLNADGSFDNTFQIGTGLYYTGGGTGYVDDAMVLSNGKILAGGMFNSIGASTFNCQSLALLSSTGTLENGYSSDGFFGVQQLEKQSNGKIIVLDRNTGLRRLNEDGTFDTAFRNVTLEGYPEGIAFFGNSMIVGGPLSRADEQIVLGLMKIDLAPKAPSSMTTTVPNVGEIVLSWKDNASVETGYVVERSVTGPAADFTTLATLPANTITYSDQSVAANTTYYYRVKAKGNLLIDSDYGVVQGVAFGDGGVWKLKADFDGIARTDAVGFSVAGKGYVGLGWAGGAQTANFRSYNPDTDTWSTQVAGFGGSVRSEAAAFVVGTKAYVGTGEWIDRENDLWEYDPSANTWTVKTDFGGTARTGAIGFAIGDKGYIGTGRDDAGYTKDFWRFDPVGNGWTQVASLPGDARRSAVVFVIGNNAYAGTGHNGTTRLKDFYKYDPVANEWTAIAAFPGVAREEAVAFAVDGKGYVGTGDSGNDLKDFWSYDPATNSWQQVVNFGGTARSAATAFAHNGKGYLTTGFDGSNRKDLWEFTPVAIAAIPVGPSGLTATTVSASQINLQWTDNSTNESEFVIERSAVTSANFQVLTTLPANSTSYSDTGLDPATTYYYRVKAATASTGSSAFSANASAITLPLPPAAPTSLAAAVSATSGFVELSWKDNATTESGYIVERSTGNNANFTVIANLGAGASSYTDMTTMYSTTYYYRVKSENAGGSSAYSNTVGISTGFSPVFIPSSVTAEALTSSSIRLRWRDNSSNETGFIIMRSTDAESNFSQLATKGVDAVEHIDMNLQENTTYYYKIQATSSSGSSSFTAAVSAKTPKAIPAVPTNLTATYEEASDNITLAWVDASVNEESFVIEKSFDGTTFTIVTETANTTYTDENPGSTWKVLYRVAAKNSGGTSAYSNVAQIVITGVEANAGIAGLKTYPNPVTDKLTVELSSPERGQLSVKFYDITGHELRALTYEKTHTDFVEYIDLEDMTDSAILVMKVSIGRKLVTKKVVVK